MLVEPLQEMSDLKRTLFRAAKIRLKGLVSKRDLK
jgi:hypothetical protein